MATKERQPPPAQSKTTSIYNTVLSLYIKVPYPNIIQVILWRFKIIKLKKSAWFPAIWWGAVGICLQKCGHTKEGGWGEWQVDMNVPSLNSFWKVGHDMPLLVFKPSLCHLPPFYLVLCHCFKAMSLGSKTSHCSGNEPVLLHWTDGSTHELSIVNYHPSDHWLLKSSRQHKLNSLEQTSNGGCKGVVWCGVRSCFTAFYTKNSETFTKKTVGLEKLANDKYVFEIQPTISGPLLFSSLQRSLLTANVKEMSVKLCPFLL